MWLTGTASRYLFMPMIAALIGIVIDLVADRRTRHRNPNTSGLRAFLKRGRQDITHPTGRAGKNLALSAVLLWAVSLADLGSRLEDLHEQVKTAALSGAAELGMLMGREKCVYQTWRAAVPLMLFFLVVVPIMPTLIGRRRARRGMRALISLLLGLACSLLNWVFFRL